MKGPAIQGVKRLAFQVPASEAGERLDHFLVGLIPDHSRSQIQRLIKAGHVRLGGRTATPHTAVRAGDAIVVDVPPAVEAKPTAQPLPLDILYEDENLVVVNKAAGMVVHPAAGHADGTLVNALLHHIEDLSGVGGERRPGMEVAKA